jgi:hypothetical protein
MWNFLKFFLHTLILKKSLLEFFLPQKCQNSESNFLVSLGGDLNTKLSESVYMVNFGSK